jgi:3-carboxy-cis,cis-muconate cycloisomerase
MTTSTGRAGPFNLLDTLYADDVMTGIWSERRTVQTWLDAESALAQAQAEFGVLKQSDADAISAACTLDNVDLVRLWDRARIVGYPILPLVRMITDALPPGPDGRVHYGATTQDIMDTALSVQLKSVTGRLLDLLMEFGDALAGCTERYQHTVMAARTHAQQAVPTTFGAKTATFLAEVTRHVDDVRRTGDDAARVSLFGAGGTNAAAGPESPAVRHALARRLGLHPADVPWHVTRDRVARFGLTCATVSATCVRFAREIVDLSRSEIGEVTEQEGHHRGASSTMPQKANPIASEAIIGQGVSATVAVGGLLRAMEAGHERSAGEWQVEWKVLPAVTGSCASALRLAGETAATLKVFPAAMVANIARDGGLLMAEALMMRLAPLMGRERAHDLAYAAAERARTSGTDLVAESRALLPPDVLAEVGDLDTTPEAYLGEASGICTTALRGWRYARARVEAPEPT